MPSLRLIATGYCTTVISLTFTQQTSEKTVRLIAPSRNPFILPTHTNATGSSGVYNVSGIPPGDYTLRVIAYDPLRGEDRAVIRNRLWVHSSDPIDQYCIMYLKNRGWGVSGNTFSVDFTGTGEASGPNAEFECSVDRQPHEPCEYEKN